MRDRQTDRQTNREAQREGDRQTGRDKERDTERGGQTDKQTDRDTHREPERCGDRQPDRETDTESGGQTARQTETQRQTERGGRQTDRQTDRQTETETETDTERERKGVAGEAEGYSSRCHALSNLSRVLIDEGSTSSARDIGWDSAGQDSQGKSGAPVQTGANALMKTHRQVGIGVRTQRFSTSTETVRTVRDGEPRTATSSSTQLLSSV